MVTVHGVEKRRTRLSNKHWAKRASRMLDATQKLPPGLTVSALQAKSFVCSRMGGRWRNRAGANKQVSLSEPQSGFLLRNHGVAKITPVSHSGRYWLLAWPQGLLSSIVKCQEIEILLPVHLCSRQVIQPVVVSATAPLYRAQSCHYAEAAKERRK